MPACAALAALLVAASGVAEPVAVRFPEGPAHGFVVLSDPGGEAPVLVRFEGPLYAEGPTWRIGLAAPRFDE